MTEKVVQYYDRKYTVMSVMLGLFAHFETKIARTVFERSYASYHGIYETKAHEDAVTMDYSRYLDSHHIPIYIVRTFEQHVLRLNMRKLFTFD